MYSFRVLDPFKNEAPVVNLADAVATGAAAGSVCLLVGNAVVGTGGNVRRAAAMCAKRIMQEYKVGSGLQKAQITNLALDSHGITVAANAALTAETGIAVVVNATAVLQGSTQILRAALTQCLEALAESMIAGQTAYRC